MDWLEWATWASFAVNIACNGYWMVKSRQLLRIERCLQARWARLEQEQQAQWNERLQDLQNTTAALRRRFNLC